MHVYVYIALNYLICIVGIYKYFYIIYVYIVICFFLGATMHRNVGKIPSSGEVKPGGDVTLAYANSNMCTSIFKDDAGV